MGAQAGNVRLAGDAAGRQKAAAEGVRMRREALNRANQGGGSGPAVVGEEPGSLPSTIARQEAFAARPGQETPFETQAPQFAPGLEANPPRPEVSFAPTGPATKRPERPGTRMSKPLNRVESQLQQKGSPEYEQVMQRIRGMAQMRNTGSKF
jgi:hypothetical protein